MPLRLHAVTPHNGHTTAAPDRMEEEAFLVPYRELAAVVTTVADFRPEEIAPATVLRHRTVVDAVFRRGPVLPAPVGVVFRAADVLVRWMELHYVVLQDALGYLEDRVEARVHAIPASDHGSPDSLRHDGAAPATSANEAFHALRRTSVTFVPLAHRPPDVVASSAFLLDKARWAQFESAVGEQREAHGDLRLEVTGPWPPYDFVRMRFQTGNED